MAHLKPSFLLAAQYFLKYALRANDRKHEKQLAGRLSYSQAGQDLFALFASGFKKHGSYVEIGAHDPIRDNNSFLLEQNYGWRGVSLEIDHAYAYFFNRRRQNRCIEADATRADYREIFLKANLPKEIDCLQIDIDPAIQSLRALQSLPLNDYRFRAITFEHDRYQESDDVMLQSREILRAHGYVLLMPNIRNLGLDVEDWWVDPAQVSEAILNVKQESSLPYEEAITLLLEASKPRPLI
jgi:hypothetical protein